MTWPESCAMVRLLLGGQVIRNKFVWRNDAPDKTQAEMPALSGAFFNPAGRIRSCRRTYGSEDFVFGNTAPAPVFPGCPARIGGDAGFFPVPAHGRHLCGTHSGGQCLCGPEPGHAPGHHQLCPGRPHRGGVGGAHLGAAGRKAPPGSGQPLYLCLSAGGGAGRPYRRGAVPAGPHPAGLDGRRGRTADPGGAGCTPCFPRW